MKDEFIAGRNPVIEAMRGKREIHKIWIHERIRRTHHPIFHLAKEQGILIQTVPKGKLDQLSPIDNHQGVVASLAAHRYAGVDELLHRAKVKGESAFFILLDGIEDPHNLGSILRTADAVRAHGVIIPKRRSVGLTATVAKTSAGAIEYVPVARVANLSQTMDQLKKHGLWLVGTAAGEKQDVRQVDLTLPLGLVIGSEGKGIRRLVKEKCDFHVNLPMAGHVSSLNASVAAGIFMYEVYRRRMKG